MNEKQEMVHFPWHRVTCRFSMVEWILDALDGGIWRLAEIQVAQDDSKCIEFLFAESARREQSVPLTGY
jgi:hypothetical protein